MALDTTRIRHPHVPGSAPASGAVRRALASNILEKSQAVCLRHCKPLQTIARVFRKKKNHFFLVCVPQSRDEASRFFGRRARRSRPTLVSEGYGSLRKGWGRGQNEEFGLRIVELVSAEEGASVLISG
jgi:hypothetical protein